MVKIEKENPSRVVIVPRPSVPSNSDTTSTTTQTKSALGEAVKKMSESEMEVLRMEEEKVIKNDDALKKATRIIRKD
ncbi:MAG: hypothetical protein J6N50_10230 [Bacteroidales bacterium]|jgi:hypothetical protein|nr:hypothetical protein [Bacteroidales bacterium]MBO6239159.1 hypothetical protein [Bacteroidales bacterium]MDO4999543.1 hypothetical protein [Bacteroidales bacterium]